METNVCVCVSILKNMSFYFFIYFLLILKMTLNKIFWQMQKWNGNIYWVSGLLLLTKTKTKLK